MGTVVLLEPPFLSIQGEGIDVGRPVVFVRFAGCNLKCRWCDTPDEGRFEWPLEKVILYVRKLQSRQVEFTGGEPTLFQKGIFAIISGLGSDFKYSIQTNGENGFFDGLDFWTVSPKLPSAIEKSDVQYVSDILKEFLCASLKKRLEIKFVIGSEFDSMVAFQAIHHNKYLHSLSVPIIVQPVTKDSFPDRISDCLDLAYSLDNLGYNVRVIPQVHKYIGVS